MTPLPPPAPPRPPTVRIPFFAVCTPSNLHPQSELIDFDAQAAAWTPPPPTLDESDLRRAEQEADALVQRPGAAHPAGDDAREAHLARVAGLEETLATIVEGGEARLKAEREAAAVSGVRGCLVQWSVAPYTYVRYHTPLDRFSRPGNYTTSVIAVPNGTYFGQLSAKCFLSFSNHTLFRN